MRARVVICVLLLLATDGAARAASIAGVPSAFGGPTAAAPGAAAMYPAVARIIAPGGDSTSYGSGTLVAVNERHGLVITNWHVVNEATGPVTVVFPDGFQSPGTVQKVDRTWDLAAIAIWRPPAQPVTIARRAALPGEPLTIAGYGPGRYRSATGRCTQYVAPGMRQPAEMVELAATARQGDSGGPIFNAGGELAGVLFGEGGGRTAGSFSGRVQWFLADIVPSHPEPQPMIAQRQAPAQQPAAIAPPIDVADDEPSLARRGPLPIDVDSAPPERGIVTTVPSLAPQFNGGSATAEQLSPVRSQTIGWRDLAGSTLPEQIKSVLAVVGSIVVLAHVLRIATGGSEAA